MRKINAEDRCVCSWDPRNSRRNATCHTHLVKAARKKKRRGGTDEPSAPRQPHHSPSAQPQLLRSPARITQHTHSQTRRQTHTRTRTQTHTHTERHRQREKERERDKHTHTHTYYLQMDQMIYAQQAIGQGTLPIDADTCALTNFMNNDIFFSKSALKLQRALPIDANTCAFI